MNFKMTVVCGAILLAAFGMAAPAEAPDDAVSGYLGAAGGVLLPGNGNSLRRAAEVTVRGGCYLTETFALELEGRCAPSAVSSVGGNATVSAVGVSALCHLSGWTFYDRLFGCERFDPFVTCGGAVDFAGHAVFADGSHRTAIGPAAGFGAFYHLTERWSVRGDVRAQFCPDTPWGMLYGVSLGLQYAFGGCE